MDTCKLGINLLMVLQCMNQESRSGPLAWVFLFQSTGQKVLARQLWVFMLWAVGTVCLPAESAYIFKHKPTTSGLWLEWFMAIIYFIQSFILLYSCLKMFYCPLFCYYLLSNLLFLIYFIGFIVTFSLFLFPMYFSL